MHNPLGILQRLRGLQLRSSDRAILLGSVRKPMSLLDWSRGELAQSPRHFASLLEAVRTESFPASCWQHHAVNLRQGEWLVGDRRAEAARSACPDLEQADPFGAVRRPSSAAEKATREGGWS